MTPPRILYRIGLTNWLMAEPWKVYPLWKSGWHYERIWESLGAWKTVREHPVRRLWWTITWPHVHDPREDDE